MIVFCENKKRVKSFNKINKKIRTQLFPAINSVNFYDKYSNMALGKGYCTMYYEKITRLKRGKLGCNLSHQKLLEFINKESCCDWNLILEDDVDINIDLFEKNVDSILSHANDNNARYIQLYTHPKFLQLQTKQKCICEDLYKMTFQWGTCAYFIHKDAIKDFIDNFPLNENIDIEYGKKISKWKSLCWINNGIQTIGSIDINDATSRLGSLINHS